jgi:hypothetical protein
MPQRVFLQGDQMLLKARILGFAVLMMLACAAQAQTNPGFLNGAPLCANTNDPGCANAAIKNPLGLNQAFSNKQDIPAANLVSPATQCVQANSLGFLLGTGAPCFNGQLPAGTMFGNAGTATAAATALPITGIDQNVLNPQTGNYTIAPTDCGKTIQAGTSAPALFTITLPSNPGANGFAANCSILVKNNDGTRGKILSGFPGDVPIRLWPGQTVGVKRVSNGPFASSYVPGRWAIGPFGNTIKFFIDGSLGNDANDGLAAGSGAFKTFNNAITTILTSLDTQQQVITIQLAAGQSWNNFVVPNAPFGGGFISLDLNGNTLDGLNSGTGAALYVTGGINGSLILSAINGTITCSTGLYGIAVISGVAGLGVHTGTTSDITMGACPNGAHFWTDSPFSRMVAFGDYTIAGSAKYHWVAANGGLSDFDSAITVHCTGSPAFSQAFAYAFNVSVLVSNEVFSGCGGITGTRYLVTLNSTSIGTATIPGNGKGVVTTGGMVDSPGIPTAACSGSIAAPVVTGTDTSGHLTEGTGTTGCTITFATGNQPSACSVSLTSAAASPIAVAVTPTQLGISHTSVDNQILYWICRPQGD